MTGPGCYICPGFPIGDCQGPISNGQTCEAHTINHACVETGTLTFSCPAVGASAAQAYDQTLSIGSHWGAGSSFRVFNGSLGYDADGRPKRNAHLQSVVGGFDVKCKVCGLDNLNPVDTDGRVGHLRLTVQFGPNILNGVVDETGVLGYRIYLVSGCSAKVGGPGSELAYVAKSNHNFGGTSVDGYCGCPTTVYQAQVEFQLPANLTDGRLMIVPLLRGGIELPMGTISENVQDYTDPTITTTTITTTTTRALPTSSVQLSGNIGVAISCTVAPQYVERPQVLRGWYKALSQWLMIPESMLEVHLSSACSRRLDADGQHPAGNGRALQSTNTGQAHVDYTILWSPSDQINPSLLQVYQVRTLITASNRRQVLTPISSDRVNLEVASSGDTTRYITSVVYIPGPVIQTLQPTTTREAYTTAEDGVDKGLIAGIVIGCVSCFWVVACVVFCLLCRKKKPEGTELVGTL